MRRRIKSVKNTQQITKAMKMVAASKLKRAQERVTNSRPFAAKMSEVLGDLSVKVADELSHPLLDERGDEKYLIVLISADKGLAGAFNANIIKAAQAFMNEHSAKSTEMIPIGRKGRDYFKRREVKFLDEYIGLTAAGQVKLSEAVEIRAKADQDVYGRRIDRQGIYRLYRIQNGALADPGYRAAPADP